MQINNLMEYQTVLAPVPHQSRSKNYAHLPTKDIVNWMEGYGMHPVSIQEGRTRKAHKKGFQKHIVRFRHERDTGKDSLGVAIPEIILRNAHDGTSGIMLWAGIFRGVCTNGLTVCDASFEKISIPHRGKYIKNQVIDAAFTVVQFAERALEGVENWSKMQMPYAHQLEFARKALELRFEDPEKSPVVAGDLLQVRRYEDKGEDLWSIFNRVQENITRGGIVGDNRKDQHGRTQYRTLRGISGAQRQVDLNGDLWRIADQYARLQ